ncbi:MAG: hypothetical protein CM1200mP28_18380 [Deltaproteobacteria bacterium]|nr:MAG: hypothetical protein CM1200mP28_18380 [Deltaproteobacteria bacterium]
MGWFLREQQETQALAWPGWKCIGIPHTDSHSGYPKSGEKNMLKLCGAELREVPAVPYRDENNYVKVSGRIADELSKTEPNGAIWANQFDNVANRKGHYETTGPEIFEQTDGKVDGFICAVGTGGTLAGTGLYLKERNPEVLLGLLILLGLRFTHFIQLVSCQVGGIQSRKALDRDDHSKP